MSVLLTGVAACLAAGGVLACFGAGFFWLQPLTGTGGALGICGVLAILLGIVITWKVQKQA
ncbi:MAG: hypothetical protein U0573_05720 [Phycisphaerales bacterium]|nr:hypothetical protein [Planctomycetota bacterium]